MIIDSTDQPEWGWQDREYALAGTERLFRDQLRETARTNHFHGALAGQNTVWGDQVLSAVYTRATMRGLDELGLTHDDLCWWEALGSFIDKYSRDITPSASRKSDSVPRKTLRVCLLHNNTELLSRAIHRAEAIARVNVRAEIVHIAQSNTRSPHEHVVHGVDGSDAFTPANMRAWRNKIITTVKNVSVVLGTATTVGAPAAVLFATINTASGGSAILHLGGFSHGLVSALHIAASRFETVSLTNIHGELFVIMHGCIPLQPRTHSHIYEFCARYPYEPSLVPFIDDYTPVCLAIANVQRGLYEETLCMYRSVFSTRKRLAESTSARAFQDHVAHTLAHVYPTNTAWATDTRYTF